jgi:hypothetical protein
VRVVDGAQVAPDLATSARNAGLVCASVLLSGSRRWRGSVRSVPGVGRHCASASRGSKSRRLHSRPEGRMGRLGGDIGRPGARKRVEGLPGYQRESRT